VFKNNLTTLGILAELLKRKEYPAITGTASDYIERFKNENSAVLIATDTAAKGLDMEFYPVIVNYDLLYNAVEMEQRISRCHKQEQATDVVVVNVLSKENMSDEKIFKKRVKSNEFR
jgi:ERCC4-related helicase